MHSVVTPEVLGRLGESEREELYRLLSGPVKAPEESYQRDPVGWARDVLGVPEWTLRWSLLPEYRDHVWDGTPDPIAAMLEAVAGGNDVAVESATGTGKTFGAAIGTLWFPAVFRDGRVITVAPKEDLLTKQLWMELGKHWERFTARYPQAQSVKLSVRMAEGERSEERWGAMGWACGVEADEQSATRAQGFHGAHMLVVTEETPGVPHPVMEALANTRTGAHNPQLSLGNPNHKLDALHQFAVQPGVVHIRVSAFDHPNVVCGREVIPGACTRESLERMKARLGENSPLYRSRARGLCPDQASNAIVRLEWVEQAERNWRNPLFHVGDEAWGVDVANSEDGDLAAWCKGKGRAVVSIEEFPCPDALALGERVVTEALARGVKGRYVGVDAIGVGSNVVNEAKRFGYPINAIQSGAGMETVREEGLDVEDGKNAIVGVEMFANLRAQMWWTLGVDLMHGRIALPQNPRLREELCAVTWETNKAGRIVVKSKELLRTALGRSTNLADAVVYWNWVRNRRTPKGPEVTRDFDSPVAFTAAVKRQTFGTVFKRSAAHEKRIALEAMEGY